MLELRLFGTGQARYAGSSLSGFPGQQPHSLLCYLLLNRGRPHHREHLAAVFWGRYPTATARKYLRNALWRLRSAFEAVGACAEEYVQIENDSVSFVGTSRYWLDVEEFEKTVTHYRDRRGPDLTPEQAADLAEAVDIYSGDLLEGTYEDWCLYDQERLHLLYLAVLNKLMAYHERNGTYEHGLACGERLLTCDATRERVHRQMMRLYWRLGDRNDALAQYRRCAQILQEALGVSPAEETQRLYQQMTSNSFDPEKWARGGLAGSQASSRAMAEDALQGLQRLRGVVDQVSDELNAIEQKLGVALRRLV